MMNWYEIIKRYYDLGYYTEVHLDKYVEYGKITLEEKNQITGTQAP